MSANLSEHLAADELRVVNGGWWMVVGEWWMVDGGWGVNVDRL